MTSGAGVRILVFRLGELLCGAEASEVREILSMQEATRVPGTPDVVRGLINVRGALVPLMDGRRILDAAPAVGDSVLLVAVGEDVAGLAVDEVVDLVVVNPEDLVPRDDLPGLDPRLVRSVGRLGDDSFVLLDLEAAIGPMLGEGA
jgi:purine-binding chemotaxis protein CheW